MLLSTTSCKPANVYLLCFRRCCLPRSRLWQQVTTTTLITRRRLTSSCWSPPCESWSWARVWRSRFMISPRTKGRKTGWVVSSTAETPFYRLNEVLSFKKKRCFFLWQSAALMLEKLNWHTWFSLLPMQKNVYGASVIIFEGIMSFADKELLQVRRHFSLCCFLFEELSNIKANVSGFCCLSSGSEYRWSVRGCLLSPPAAPGYENLCGHRLRHSAGAPTPQGHHRARTGHWRRHQAVQQVREASLRAVYWADHEAGGHCCAERWDCGTSSMF